MRDRIDAIADLLLGAAYADHHLHERERATIRTLLAGLLADEELPASLSARIDDFDPALFDLTAVAAPFRDDSAADKRKLLELVAAVHDADHELDLDENEYLASLAAAIGAGDDAVADLVLEVQVEELRSSLRALRAVPPPVPGSAETAVEIDD